MKNLVFVIWMIGYPLSVTISQFVSEYLLGKTYSEVVEGISALIVIFIWLCVGKLLYEGKSS